jgi:hypothetical protein
MSRTRYLVTGLVLSVIAAASTASAQTMSPAACADRGQAINHLSVKYSEAPVAMGLANNGGIVEVLASETGKSWSILITMPNGMTCLIAAGEHWEKLKPQAQGPDL